MWWMVLPIVLTLCAVALSGFVCAFLYRVGEIHVDLDKDFELPDLSKRDVFSKVHMQVDWRRTWKAQKSAPNGLCV